VDWKKRKQSQNLLHTATTADQVSRINSGDTSQVTEFSYARAAVNGEIMFKQYVLTIHIADKYADENTDALASAVSNLEYDGFKILNYKIEEGEKSVAD